MTAKILMRNRTLTLEVEGDSHKALFAGLAHVQEVFGVERCGACGGTDLKFQVRRVVSSGKPYDYYEHACLTHKCRARLSMGQSREGGGLFPKLKDEDGNYLPNGGWVVYRAGESNSQQQSGHPSDKEWD